MTKAQEIREELIPLVKAALPSKDEVYDRQRRLGHCVDMTRASVPYFNKLVKDAAAEYRRAHEPDEAELQKAVAQIKDMYLELIQCDE
jgi:hypothetical protein